MVRDTLKYGLGFSDTPAKSTLFYKDKEIYQYFSDTSCFHTKSSWQKGLPEDYKLIATPVLWRW